MDWPKSFPKVFLYQGFVLVSKIMPAIDFGNNLVKSTSEPWLGGRLPLASGGLMGQFKLTLWGSGTKRDKEPGLTALVRPEILGQS